MNENHKRPQELVFSNPYSLRNVALMILQDENENDYAREMGSTIPKRSQETLDYWKKVASGGAG